MRELRSNKTAYDAAYVALAERLDSLITCDSRLTAASGACCSFDLIA
jgi:predicted nucleic acid-binding protein